MRCGVHVCAVRLPLARAAAPRCRRCRGFATGPGACAQLGAASVSSVAARVCDEAPVYLGRNCLILPPRAPVLLTMLSRLLCIGRWCGCVSVTCPALGVPRHSPVLAMLAIASQGIGFSIEYRLAPPDQRPRSDRLTASTHGDSWPRYKDQYYG